ncbi:MAG: hypothetical protein ABIR32_10455 [Ilumatobacteraceae bacterium]
MSFNEVNRSTNESAPQNAASGRTGPSAALIAFGIVLVLGVIFFFQNGDRREIDFLFFEARTTVRFSIIIAIVIGILLDRLFSIWWRRRKRNNA